MISGGIEQTCFVDSSEIIPSHADEVPSSNVRTATKAVCKIGGLGEAEICRKDFSAEKYFWVGHQAVQNRIEPDLTK